MGRRLGIFSEGNFTIYTVLQFVSITIWKFDNFTKWQIFAEALLLITNLSKLGCLGTFLLIEKSRPSESRTKSFFPNLEYKTTSFLGSVSDL